MNKVVTMLAEMGAMYGLNTYSPRLTWRQLLLSARPVNVEPQIRNHSLGGGQAGWLHWNTSSMEGQHSVLTEVDTYAGHGFAFLYVILLPKLPDTDLQNAFSTSSGIPYIIAFDKGPHFRRVAVSPWSWNPLLLPSSLLPWNSWPDNKTKWPFEDIVTVPIGGSSLEDWGRTLQKAVYALTQCPIYDMFFPHSQNLHVQESKLEKGTVPLTITTSDPLRKFLFPVPVA